LGGGFILRELAMSLESSEYWTEGEILCLALTQWIELLEVLGSEGQDIRRYPGARSFS
jgi:hypothetical protein